jgi:hypothetical protein
MPHWSFEVCTQGKTIYLKLGKTFMIIFNEQDSSFKVHYMFDDEQDKEG